MWRNLKDICIWCLDSFCNTDEQLVCSPALLVTSTDRKLTTVWSSHSMFGSISRFFSWTESTSASLWLLFRGLSSSYTSPLWQSSRCWRSLSPFTTHLELKSLFLHLTTTIKGSINQENNHKAYTLNKRALDKMKQKLKGVNRHSQLCLDIITFSQQLIGKSQEEYRKIDNTIN